LLSAKNKKPPGKKNVFYNYRKFSFLISTTLLKGKHDQVHKNKKNGTSVLILSIMALSAATYSCKQETTDKKLKQLDIAQAVQMAGSIESLVKPELADSLTLRLWGVDSLVVSPISIDIDDLGRVYYATTNRAKNSEFDIRGHPDWEIPSIQLQTVEDKRAFLRKELSPENSKRNTWLKDLNGDGSHDWRDMTVEKENIFRTGRQER
jgi:hypothetical protein